MLRKTALESHVGVLSWVFSRVLIGACVRKLHNTGEEPHERISNSALWSQRSGNRWWVLPSQLGNCIILGVRAHRSRMGIGERSKAPGEPVQGGTRFQVPASAGLAHESECLLAFCSLGSRSHVATYTHAHRRLSMNISLHLHPRCVTGLTRRQE